MGIFRGTSPLNAPKSLPQKGSTSQSWQGLVQNSLQMIILVVTGILGRGLKGLYFSHKLWDYSPPSSPKKAFLIKALFPLGGWHWGVYTLRFSWVVPREINSQLTQSIRHKAAIELVLLGNSLGVQFSQQADIPWETCVLFSGKDSWGFGKKEHVFHML